MRPDDEYLRERFHEEQRVLSRDYYGETVRNLFLVAGIIILFSLPFFHKVFKLPYIIPILAIVVLSLCAGFTNPRLKWSLAIDAIVAGIALVVFEYYAIDAYQSQSLLKLFFLINQILALIFFFALYYCIQTLRRWMTYR